MPNYSFLQEPAFQLQQYQIHSILQLVFHSEWVIKCNRRTAQYRAKCNRRIAQPGAKCNKQFVLKDNLQIIAIYNLQLNIDKVNNYLKQNTSSPVFSKETGSEVRYYSWNCSACSCCSRGVSRILRMEGAPTLRGEGASTCNLTKFSKTCIQFITIWSV